MLLSELRRKTGRCALRHAVVSDIYLRVGCFIPLLFFERRNNLPDIIQKAENCARPAIEEAGFELVGVDYGREERLICLTFYIYSEQGVTIDDCERVSRLIEPVLEQNDPTGGTQYCLCVSSPGERPFKTERDFERNVGKTVQAELKTPVKGKKKKFTGTLLAFDAGMVIIEGRKEKYELARADIKTIRPYIGP